MFGRWRRYDHLRSYGIETAYANYFFACTYFHRNQKRTLREVVRCAQNFYDWLSIFECEEGNDYETKKYAVMKMCELARTPDENLLADKHWDLIYSKRFERECHRTQRKWERHQRR